MAIGWLSVLQWIPWGDVIVNAPKVAEAARKLWNTVAKKPAGADAVRPARTSGPESIAALQTQLDAAEAQITLLHEQMLASSELIKALADQNTQLIRHVETNRIRVLWLAGATVLAIILAVTGLTLALTR